VRDVGALRRIRGQHRALGRGPFHHPVDHTPVNHDERRDDHGANGCYHDDDHPPSDHDDRTHHRDDRTHHRDDTAHGANDTDHAEEGRADDGLHSPDDRTGHHHDGLRIDAVRPDDLFLGS
jgi:hypothetical protein